MPTPNHFAFRIRRDINNYYAYINASVVMLPAPSDPTIATEFDIQGPANFNEDGIRWERHPTFSGMNTYYSEALDFFGDGLQIVQHIFNIGDIEAPLQIEVRRLNYDTYLYEPFYTGDIDLSTFNPERGHVQVSIKESGLTSIIKAALAVPYEVEMLDANAVYTYMSGIKLRGTYNWIMPASIDIGTIFVPNDRVVSIAAFTTISEGDFQVATPNNSTKDIIMLNPEAAIAFDSGTAAQNFILEAVQDMTVKVNYSQTFTINNPTGSGVSPKFKVDLIIAKIDTLSTIVFRQNIKTVVIPDVGFYTFQADFISGDLLLLKGQRLYFVVYVADSPGTTLTYQEGKLSVSNEFILNGSAVRAFRYVTIWAYLINKITDGKYLFQSDFLLDPNKKTIDNVPFNTLISCGDGLRNLPGAKLSLNLQDLYKDSSTRWCLGMGTEKDIVRIEPLSYFYDKESEIAFFEKVTNFRVIPDLKHRGNVIRAGMENQTYDALNGKDEVQGTYLFKMPFTRVVADLDLVSPFRYDPTGLEAIRANLTNKKTTDNKADREVVLFTVGSDYEINDGQYGNPVPYGAKVFKLYRPNNSSNTSGVLFPPQLYNLDLTAGRVIRRNGPLVAAYTWQRIGQEITFQTFDKNQELRSEFSSGLIIEKGNIPLPLNDEPIFLPMLIQFTAVVPSDFNFRMAANPYGYIRVREYYNDSEYVDYRGYVNKGGIVDAENNTFDFELQAHHNNDFTKVNYG